MMHNTARAGYAEYVLFKIVLETNYLLCVHVRVVHMLCVYMWKLEVNNDNLNCSNLPFPTEGLSLNLELTSWLHRLDSEP